MKLEETIQNYYNAMNGSWDESDYTMLAWLEELRDLRTILKKRSRLEKHAEKRIAKGKDLSDDEPITLKEYIDLLDPLLDEEKEVKTWAKQLLEARKRIGDDNA